MRPTIPKTSIDRARRFVALRARRLDAAYLELLMPDQPSAGALERVLAELARFQTADGGFAHAIEPDVRSPAPSAISTSVAFQYLRQIRPPANETLVRMGIGYLARTVDRAAWVWPAVDHRVNEGPHAPWWAPNDPRFRNYLLNPTAELLGYLFEHRAYVPEDVLKGVTRTVVEAVETIGLIEGAYELYCCMRLVQTDEIPDPLRRFLKERLSRSLKIVGPDNPHLDLMRLVPTPGSFGYDLVREGIDTQAARLISSQDDDGGWRPGWDAWNDDAQNEWRGEITSRTVINLLRHGFVTG